ncbi:GNAT family protein [Kribbella sancticallisti]|uniref:GNAT family protein n=1 Tax=Kribbella sancticallisti TaxID=460087 RepID=A0ABN2C3R7_9ACTN
MTDFSVKPTLTGERVVLRPLGEDDYDTLMAAMADPDVIRFTGSRGEITEAEYREWLRTRKDQTDRLDLAIVEKATGETVGEAVLNEWSPEVESCGFRILVGPAGQNRGLGSEATRLIVSYAIEELGLHRVELGVYAFNPRAQRAYEKAGFVVEGIRRQALKWDGDRYDDVIMAVLAPEWKAAALRSEA